MQMILLIALFLSSIISLLFLFTNIILSKKYIINREKMSPFECGFEPFSYKRLPFSIQFFLISLMFLIFDIEITLIIPMVFSLIKFNFQMLSIMMIFMMILLFSVYLEYADSSLDWK